MSNPKPSDELMRLHRAVLDAYARRRDGWAQPSKARDVFDREYEAAEKAFFDAVRALP